MTLENCRFAAIIGTDPNFCAALAVAATAARGHSPVLIEGESGTGKKMLIHAVHAASSRSRTPLRIVNVGSIPLNSIETLLFGHEKGSFVGAFERQIGAFQQCDGGTLAIDGIDRLPMEIQERLVEALTRGVYLPIGAPYGYRVDVRLIAVSNLPLTDLVAGGHFLPELLKAFSAAIVSLPPLRNRPGDMAALCRHFLAPMNEQLGLPGLGITEDALELLGAYHWPGNVRELQEALARAALFCTGDALTVEDFPRLSHLIGSSRSATSTPMSEISSVTLYTPDGNLRPLEEIEAEVIRLAIGLYRGRMTEVARRLGIGRSTLYRKLSELGLDRNVKIAE